MNRTAQTGTRGRKKVLFYVQHLLGIGHLKRAVTLSRALGEAGLKVTIVLAGGDALSEPLLRAAMVARLLTGLKDATWRLLAGHALPEEIFVSLRAAAKGGVIAPYAGGKETEQTLRARLLHRLGAFQVVAEDELDGETVARAAERALGGLPAAAAGLDTDGARESARILVELVHGREQVSA